MSECYAFITKNSIYAVIDGRWVRTTDLRPGRDSNLDGGWETLEQLSRSTDNGATWTVSRPQDVRPGDRIQFASSSFYAASTPVLHTVEGTDHDLGGADRLDGPETSIVLARSEAFIVTAGAYLRLLPGGGREQVAREDVVPHLRWAMTFTATVAR